MKRAWIVVLAAVTGRGLSAQTAPRASLAARVDSMATAALAQWPAVGLSIAVVRGNDTVVMKGYGRADLENDVPASARTVYRIGSITKQFTAVAILQLVEQGKLTLDDTIQRFLRPAGAARATSFILYQGGIAQRATRVE